MINYFKKNVDFIVFNEKVKKGEILTPLKNNNNAYLFFTIINEEYFNFSLFILSVSFDVIF